MYASTACIWNHQPLQLWKDTSQTCKQSRPSLFSSSCLLKKKETGGGDMYRCVITQHVCIAPTNLIRAWAAQTPVPHGTSWCDKPIITQDYSELPSLCFLPLSFPAITYKLKKTKTAVNSAGWQGNDCISRIKQQLNILWMKTIEQPVKES